MVENFLNDFVLCDEGDHAEVAPAITFQGVDLIDLPNELSPTFSESGSLFWRELGFVLGCQGVCGAERLKGETSLFTVSPRFRRVGSKVMNAVFPKLWNLGNDSSQELEYVECLAFRWEDNGSSWEPWVS
jgi:hypothetical protein